MNEDEIRKHIHDWIKCVGRIDCGALARLRLKRRKSAQAERLSYLLLLLGIKK